MFEDRYLPVDDDHDEYELTREDPRRHSHKHDKAKKSRKDKAHREDGKHHSDKRGSGTEAGPSSRRHASEEIEDGEIMEDGEIVEDGEGQPSPKVSERPAAGGGLAARSVAADAVNGKHRLSEDGSQQREDPSDKHRSPSPAEPSPPRPSSRPPSRRDRDSSREPAAAAAAAAGGSSRDHKSKGGSRERSKDRSSSRRERERESDRDRSERQQREREQLDRARHSSRDPSSRAADRYHRGTSDAGDGAAGEGRYNSGRPYSSSAGGSGAPGSSRLDSSSRQERADRERERGDRYRRDLRYDGSTAVREQRYNGSTAVRDQRYDGSTAVRDERDRRRRSRSRSRQGRRGEDERDRHYKRGRDRSRGREDGKRRRHHHGDSSSEPELDLDPNALMAVDPLGLTAAEKEEEEEKRRLEESRKRRQAILAKHQQPAAVAAPTATAAAPQHQAGAAAAGTAAGTEDASAQQQQQQQQQGQPQGPDSFKAAAAAAAAPAGATAADAADGTATPEGERSSSSDSHNAPGSPMMDIWNTGAAAGAAAGAGGEVSSRAADEEPTSQLPVHLVAPGTEPNMQSERLRVGQGGGAAGAAAAAAPAAAAKPAAAAAAAGDDMFAEDDMFAAGDGDVAAAAGASRRGPAVPAGLMDNYDDAEGYYNFQVGEVLDGRYEVFACKGKGVFSTVLRARDLLRQVNAATGAALPAAARGAAAVLAPGAEYAEVAIKVIRSNDTMSKAAALEQRILRLLGERDPDNKKHVIRLLRTFEYRQHVCMVFEPLDMNLRELTLKYGRNVGLNITAVAIYAAQLLVALRHMQQCRVLHADIKPDNILVNARRSKVKICDLGSAMLAGENERTPYLVSRFYRAPEVILGLAYDFPMDMWSVGCVLYELFTGKILFPGRSNNEMLKLMMDVKGPFPKKMLKRGIFVDKHFEDEAQLSFALVEEDPVTKQPIRRVIPNPTVKHNFAQLLARAEGDRAQVAALADLLERMLALDPDKRIEPDAALRHPFVKPWLPKKKNAAGGQ